MTTQKDTKQISKKIWGNFWKEKIKKNFFGGNFLKLFGKHFWTIFEENFFLCLFVLCHVVSFKRHMCWDLSYWYDMTHLDSLIMFINCLPIYLTSSFWSLLWSSSGPLHLTRKDLVINIPNPYGTLWLIFRHFWNCKKWNLVKNFFAKVIDLISRFFFGCGLF